MQYISSAVDRHIGGQLVCRMSVCLWGHVGLAKTEATLLSAAEMKRLRNVCACIKQECCRDGKLVLEKVMASEAVGRMVAEVAATSSEHRRAAAKRAQKDPSYRGVVQINSQPQWWAQICRTEDGNANISRWGPFDTKAEAARIYDTAALSLHRGYGHLRDACYQQLGVFI